MGEPELSEVIAEVEETSGRDSKGRWLPGVSGGYKAPRTPKEMKEVFRCMAPQALTTLWEILRDVNGKYRGADRVKAAEVILERGYGRVAQTVELGDGANSAILILPARNKE